MDSLIHSYLTDRALVASAHRPLSICTRRVLFSFAAFRSPMSSASSSKKKQSKQVAAAAAAAVDDVDMSGEASDFVGEFVPSTKIGSYLSQNYNMEVEAKKVPGFICGRQCAANQTTRDACARQKEEQAQCANDRGGRCACSRSTVRFKC